MPPLPENIVVVASKGLTINITHSRSQNGNELQRFYWAGWSWREDDEGWYPIEDILKVYSLLATWHWTPELTSVEYWMSEHNEGGGLTGIEDEYFETKSKLTKLGYQLIREQLLQDRIEKEDK